MNQQDSPDHPCNWPDTILMECVRDNEGGVAEDSVFLRTIKDRPNIIAFNQGGFDFTEVDLLDVLDWADKNSELVTELRRKAEG